MVMKTKLVDMQQHTVRQSVCCVTKCHTVLHYSTVVLATIRSQTTCIFHTTKTIVTEYGIFTPVNNLCIGLTEYKGVKAK
jgi:hypothetical protein